MMEGMMVIEMGGRIVVRWTRGVVMRRHGNGAEMEGQGGFYRSKMERKGQL